MDLNAKSAAALELPAGKDDAIFFDAGLAGFGYRLRRGAGDQVRPSWIAQYRFAGRTRRVLIGSATAVNAADARAAAKKILGRVALGEDPQGAKHDRRGRDAHTFASVVTDFLKAKQPDVRPKTFIITRRYLTGPYFKPLHAMPVDAITRKDVAACLVKITATVTAARAKAAISSFYSWAMQSGLVDANPVIGTPDRKEPPPRERVLTDAELVAVLQGCGADDYGKVLRLLILTGCRRQEVGSMTWAELDPNAGAWTIPAQRTKNGRAHTLPLPPAAWAIIDAVPRKLGRDFLFGAHSAIGYNAWHDGKAELDQKLGDQVAPWRVHDLRRTAATGMADIGIAPHVIEAILNHQSGHKAGVAGIYNRSTYEREMRAALALWADHVRVLIDGGEHKVIAFTPAS